MSWQLIETAPKDGTRVLLTCAGYKPSEKLHPLFRRPKQEFEIYHLAWWATDHWSPFIPNDWTHWHELPEPPK